MKTPAFWKTKNLIAKSLLPFGIIYSAATGLRLKMKSAQKIGLPVLCVGNLTAGGTGKTPVAIALASLLKNCGYNPAFVSRGYGGRLSNILVDPHVHTAKEVGDEPLILAREAPVSINADRYLAALNAQKNGANLIIMDDGFQNPGLYKNISFLVFDGGYGLGNGYPLPAGPLRENFAQGIKRASAAIIIGKDRYDIASLCKNLPIFSGKIVSQLPKLSTRQVIAFAGIGRPQKFYDSLAEHNVKIVDTIDFPDHHFYTNAELRNMVEQAETSGAELITTSKDFVKIPPELQYRFKVLDIKIKWDNEKSLEQFILEHLKQI